MLQFNFVKLLRDGRTPETEGKTLDFIKIYIIRKLECQISNLRKKNKSGKIITKNNDSYILKVNNYKY